MFKLDFNENYSAKLFVDIGECGENGENQHEKREREADEERER